MSSGCGCAPRMSRRSTRAIVELCGAIVAPLTRARSQRVVSPHRRPDMEEADAEAGGVAQETVHVSDGDVFDVAGAQTGLGRTDSKALGLLVPATTLSLEFSKARVWGSSLWCVVGGLTLHAPLPLPRS